MANLMSNLADLPMFPGWLTVASAARRLGVTTAAVHRRVINGDFKRAYRLGEPDQERFIVLLNEQEVDDLVAALSDKQLELAQMAELRAWNKRVKTWAAGQSDLPQPMNVGGPPTKSLQVAYEKAHPGDLRPRKSQTR